MYWKLEEFGQDFCFQSVSQQEGANIECEAATIATTTQILSTMSTESIEILLNTTLGHTTQTTSEKSTELTTNLVVTDETTSSNTTETTPTATSTLTSSITSGTSPKAKETMTTITRPSPSSQTTDIQSPSAAKLTSMETSKDTILVNGFSTLEIGFTSHPISHHTELQSTINTRAQQTTHHLDSVYSEHDHHMNQKALHETKLLEANKNHSTAESLAAQLTSVQSHIASLLSEQRKNREESATSCADIADHVDEISEAVNTSNLDTALVFANRITNSSVSCSEEEKQILRSKQASLVTSKSSTESHAVQYKAVAKQIKMKINAHITKLNELNAILHSFGETTIHHGTHHDHEDDNETKTSRMTTSGYSNIQSSKPMSKKNGTTIKGSSEEVTTKSLKTMQPYRLTSYTAPIASSPGRTNLYHIKMILDVLFKILSIQNIQQLQVHLLSQQGLQKLNPS